MGTVNYDCRSAGCDKKIFECELEEAEELLTTSAKELQELGYIVKEGERWFTAIRPLTGDWVTNEIR